jgi:hypothetical protein
MKKLAGWQYGLIAALAVALGACGGAAQMIPAGEAPAIRPGEALVVFMRASNFGGLVASSVFDVTTAETKFIGIVYPGNKFAHAVPAGEHTFMVVGESADFMRATLVAGRTYHALVTPRVGVWKARFSFRPVRQAELDGAEFAGWDSATHFVSNSPASLNWAMQNAADVNSKRAQYWPEWLSKPPHQQLSQTLNAEDGKPTAVAQHAAASASVASAPAAPAFKAWPSPGDTWTYRLTEPKRTDGPRQRDYVVKVASVSAVEIVERFAIDGGGQGEWTHKGERQVVPLGKPTFSPYLLAFGPMPVGALGRLRIADPACTGIYHCQATGRVIANERIQVPAGTFDAVRVEIQQNWRPVAISGQQNTQGGSILTAWYAPAAKRVVKLTSRPSFGYPGPLDTDFELELTRYQLQ